MSPNLFPQADPPAHPGTLGIDIAPHRRSATRRARAPPDAYCMGLRPRRLSRSVAGSRPAACRTHEVVTHTHCAGGGPDPPAHTPTARRRRVGRLPPPPTALLHTRSALRHIPSAFASHSAGANDAVATAPRRRSALLLLPSRLHVLLPRRNLDAGCPRQSPPSQMTATAAFAVTVALQAESAGPPTTAVERPCRWQGTADKRRRRLGRMPAGQGRPTHRSRPPPRPAAVDDEAVDQDGRGGDREGAPNRLALRRGGGRCRRHLPPAWLAAPLQATAAAEKGCRGRRGRRPGMPGKRVDGEGRERPYRIHEGKHCRGHHPPGRG